MANFLFIDDSGSKEWDTPHSSDFITSPPLRTADNRQFWQTNYFVLTGLHISQELVAKLNPEINKAKQEYFGTKDVEIRSVHLRNPEKRRKYYLEPYGITEANLKEFIDKHWYKIFEDHQDSLQLQAFVLDKRYYKDARAKKSPLEITARKLFDGVEMHPNRACTIVFDQMDAEIKSVNHQQGKILKISRQEVDLGSYEAKYSHASVTFERSSNSNFLQLADTVAYNVLRQFVDHGDDWERPRGRTLEVYEYFDRIIQNFYCDDRRRVNGNGIFKVPPGTQRNWVKLEKSKIGEAQSKNTR